MPAPEETPVLVVGAGPAGLAAALELARHGVPFLLVERRERLSSHPRATALSLRSMELVRSWGLEAAVRARSVEVEWSMLEAETLARAAAGTAVPVGYPSAHQSRVLSPTAPACVAQDDLEPLLLDELRGAPGARVALATEVAGLVAGRGGAQAALRDVRTGALRAVHARYVVAADGARSAVRRALGVALAGADDLMVGHQTLFRAPLWDVVGARRHVIYSVPEAAFVPAGREDRWIMGVRGDAPDERRAVDLIRMGAGVPDLPVRVEGIRSFSSGSQVAERWRSGCVLLAGDAAHRVTPRGGMGLNLALQDGHALGWRLAWVLRGWAGEEVLDSYEADRRPAAEHVAARSADPQGSIRTADRELHADLGGRITHVWIDGHSTLDLLAPGLTVFTTRADCAPPPARAPVTVRRVDPLTARALGVPAGRALLVRSDGAREGVLSDGAARG